MSRRPVPAVPALLAAVAVLSGCASVPPGDTARGDPWERLNRQTFAFNEAVDQAAIKPAAQLYQAAVPAVARRGVSNFFGNIGDAWTSINLVLQAKPKAALNMGMRTAVNTVLGLGGVLDVAEEAGLERFTSEDFGQTLGFWGLQSGPYLVLPLIGPSNLRDSAARLLEVNDSPVSRIWLEPRDHNPALALQLLDTRVNLLNAGRVFDEIALDKYVLIRDAYLSRRRSLIYDGEPPEEGGAGPAPFKKQLAPQ
jgi:phospholipid-binding lipoprotein MlaA